MSSCVREDDRRISIEHRLTFKGRENRLSVIATKPASRPTADSTEHFFKEHEWGFGTGRRGQCLSYQVAHPCWDCFRVESYALEWDWRSVYGEEFAFLGSAEPCSVVAAVGSEVSVFPKRTRDA
jgi:hypothetical protein